MATTASEGYQPLETEPYVDEVRSCAFCLRPLGLGCLRESVAGATPALARSWAPVAAPACSFFLSLTWGLLALADRCEDCGQEAQVQATTR